MNDMQGIRNQVLDLVREHEQAEHDGQVCASRRIDVVAYLAHALGMHRHHAEHIGMAIEEYDQRCPCNRPEVDTHSQPAHVPHNRIKEIGS